MSTKQVGSVVSNLIKSRILMSGPIPVADYMRISLTAQPSSFQNQVTKNSHQMKKNAVSEGGYYMKQDVFGQRGDFITSPEISQMFGELLAAWGLETWIQIGGPKKFNIVELGPGRGTLSKDMLRVFKQFEHLTGNEVSLHLVEISPFLASVQYATLCSSSQTTKFSSTTNNDSFISDAKKEIKSTEKNLVDVDPMKESQDGKGYYHHAIARETGYPVYWYRNVVSLPKEFSFYIAHEFFDALPAHKLQKVGNDWREVLVDVNENETQFRFVISRHETPVIKLLRQHYPKILEDSRQHIEVSVDGLGILGELTNRLDADGGIATIIDYGHDGTKEDTFRAFSQHKLHDPLLNPGSADLTTDVDFSIVKNIFNDKALICGPTSQHDFLTNIGIDYRLQMLLKNCKTEVDKENLQSGYKMIMQNMGTRFLFMTLFPKILETCMPNFKVAGYVK